MTPDTLLIATSNPGKHREVSAILEDLPLHLESLADHPPLPEPVEDGATFEQNAERKALHYAELTGRWTLADDSGLMVDALDGAPGVYSARYAGPENDAAANNAKLIAAAPDLARLVLTLTEALEKALTVRHICKGGVSYTCGGCEADAEAATALAAVEELRL